MQGVMNILDRTGHTSLAWAEGSTVTNKDADAPLDPAFVTAEFDRLVAQGHLAFSKDPKTGERVQMPKGKAFDPREHEEVTMVPPFVGG